MVAETARAITLEQLRTERLARERDYYTSEEGFLDFVRDSGAAPDAEWQPHGRYCQQLITWRGEKDPDNEEITNFKAKMALWPRGSFKSQVFTIGQAAWMIARDPNIRILICSETARQAQKFASEVMKIVDSQWFRDRFGVHRGDKWKEASGVFYSALRTRQGIKDPTLAAAGVGEVQTGAHWDVVLMDDVCSQENTKTPESIESLWVWFSEVQSQLDPGTKLFVIGTLHHYNDIYCRIIKDEAIAATFEISKHAWADPIVDPRSKDPATLFFPKRLTRAFITDRKIKQVPRLFACFYENRPQTGDEQLFHTEYFHVIRDQDIPSAVWSYIFTDFAFIADEKKNARADRSCFWVVSLDCNRTAYVRDFYVGRWRPSDSCRIVCDLWGRFQPLNVKGVGVEKVTHKELLMSLFEEIRRQTFIRPRFIEIEGRNQEIKDIRIEAIEPRFRGGNIYFAESLRQQFQTKWKPMIDEMTEWPFGKHDDIPDAISDLDKIDSGGKFYFPAPPPGWTPMEVKRFQPPTVDGRYNPQLDYPAREFTKNKEHDLWGNNKSGGEPGSLFRGTPNQSNRDIFGPQ
jgi:hypothetical protein